MIRCLLASIYRFCGRGARKCYMCDMLSNCKARDKFEKDIEKKFEVNPEKKGTLNKRITNNIRYTIVVILLDSRG